MVEELLVGRGDPELDQAAAPAPAPRRRPPGPAGPARRARAASPAPGRRDAPCSWTSTPSTTRARTPAPAARRANADRSSSSVAPRLVSGWRCAERDQGLGVSERRALEYDRGKVEQDAVEQRRELLDGRSSAAPTGSVAPRSSSPTASDAAEDPDAHVPASGPVRARAHRAPAPSAVPSGGHLDPVVRRVRQRTPHGIVRIVVGEPVRPAQHPGGGALPVGARPVVLGGGEAEGARLGLEALGLVEPTRHVVAHVMEVRSARPVQPPRVRFST